MNLLSLLPYSSLPPRSRPLRRSWLRPKAKRARTNLPWKPERIQLDAAGMAQLRLEAFVRSRGFCEMENCQKCVTWETGELDHIKSRAHLGSDTIENVRFICRGCHRRRTGEPQWSHK